MRKFNRFLPAIALVALALVMYFGHVSWGDSPQTYSGNSNISVGTTPQICVNYGGKISYTCHNRSTSQPVICWPINSNATPSASPTPGAGVPMIEVPAGGNLNDTVAPEQLRDPFLQGWACAEPTATSTATLDGVWR